MRMFGGFLHRGLGQVGCVFLVAALIATMFPAWVAADEIDITAPTIHIEQPYVAQEVVVGMRMVANFSCEDENGGSGVAKCEGTVGFNEPIDTSSLGPHEFEVIASDNAGNEATQTVPYVVISDVSHLTGVVTDSSGAVLPGSSVRIWPVGHPESSLTAQTDTSGAYSLDVKYVDGPSDTWFSYDVQVKGPEGSGLGVRDYHRELSGVEDVWNWSLGPALPHLSGTISDGTGANTLAGWTLSLNKDGTTRYKLQSKGSSEKYVSGSDWQLDVEPGTYQVVVTGWSSTMQFGLSATEDVQGDAVLNLHPTMRDLSVTVTDVAGMAVSSSSELQCSDSSTGSEDGDNWTKSTASGAGPLTLYGMPTAGNFSCNLTVTLSDGLSLSRPVELAADAANEVTIQVPSTITLSGILSDGVVPGDLTSGGVSVEDSSGRQVARAQADLVTGAWSVAVFPGTYRVWSSVQSVRRTDAIYAEHGAQEYTHDSVVDVTPVTRDVTLRLQEADGSPVTGSVYLYCLGVKPAGQDAITVQDTSSRADMTGEVKLFGTPTADDSPCLLQIQRGGEIVTRPLIIGTQQTDPIIVRLEPTIHLTVTGQTASTPLGATASIQVIAHSPYRDLQGLGYWIGGWADSRYEGTIEGGAPWSGDVVPGDYQIDYTMSGRTGSYYDTWSLKGMTPLASHLTDGTVTIAPVLSELVVSLRAADGTPGHATVTLTCTDAAGTTSKHSTRLTGDASLWGTSASEGDCSVSAKANKASYSKHLTLTPGGITRLTLQVTQKSIVEIPSQPNVTALEAAVAGSDAAPVITLTASEGASFTNLTTLDANDSFKVSTPPPSGVTLPLSLTKFVLSGIEPGSTQTVTMYVESTEGVNGYAKYDPSTSTWSLLPADRVTIVDAQHISIRLTDGGIGDADGVANGSIDDPGGLAVVAAPTVTSVSPSSGPVAGGTAVTISGTGFQTGATVTVAGVAASGVVVVNDTKITLTTPAGSAGARDVVVTNPDSQTVTASGGFTYVAAPTVTGGTPLLDDFSRANGAVGANWIGTTGQAFYKISNKALDVELGGPLIYNTDFGTSQEASVKLTTVDTKNPSQGVLLKIQSAKTTDAGAISVVYDAVSKAVRVSTFRVGDRDWTAYTAKGVTFTNGDILTGRVRANGTVEIFRNDTKIATITLSAADQKFFNTKGGRIGIWTLAATKAVLDDFGGSTLNS